MKKRVIIPTIFALFANTSFAQTTIIGGTLRNGDFNAEQAGETSTDVIPFDRTDFWENANSATQTFDCTRTNIQVDGTRSCVIYEVANRAAGQDTGYNVVAGDSFNVKYVWRDAFNWDDASDQIAIRLFTTDDGLILGNIVDEKILLSGTSTGNNVWESVDQTVFFPEAEGKRLFVAVDSQDGNSSLTGFGRVDNFELIVTAASAGPELAIDSGDYTFGQLIHLQGTDSASRTVTFRNAGASGDLTVDALTLTDDGGGVYTITSAPTLPATIAAGTTFDVEITATGGGGGALLPGALLVDTSPDSEDTTVPISATILTTGDPFSLVENPCFDDGINGWEGEVFATAGLTSPTGAIVEGYDTVNNFVSNLGQTLSNSATDLDIKVSFAIPDFEAYTGDPADAANNDRSFQLVLGRFAGANFVNNPVNQGNALLSLLYFPAGNVDSATPGWYVYQGDGTTGSFQHLPALGTLLASTNASGTYSGVEPPETLNVYELNLAARDFESTSASYTITLSGPGITGTASSGPLTAFYNTTASSPEFFKIATVAVTTNDFAADSLTNPTGLAIPASFWVDKFQAALTETLPVAIAEQVTNLSPITVAPEDCALGAFSIRNIGIGADLEVTAADFTTNTNFILESPALPVSIPVGSTQEFVVKANAAGIVADSTFTDTLTLTSNDVFGNVIEVQAEALTVAGGQRILVDFDDEIAGNGIHDASIRNGGFEDDDGTVMVGDDIFFVPEWTNIGPTEGFDIPALFDTNPATGTQHSRASGFVQVDPAIDRLQPTQIFTLDDWVLQEGHVIEFQVDVIGDGLTLGGIGVIADCRNENGALVSDAINGQVNPSRIISANQNPGINDATYTRVTFTTPPIVRGSPWIGNTFSFRFNNNETRDSYRFIDNVRVIARAPIAEVPAQLEIIDCNFDTTNNMITLRWVDTFTDYDIEYTDDLDFTSGVTTVTADPLDFSIPDEVAFTFPFDFSSNTKTFFRVVEVPLN